MSLSSPSSALVFPNLWLPWFSSPLWHKLNVSSMTSITVRLRVGWSYIPDSPSLLRQSTSIWLGCSLLSISFFFSTMKPGVKLDHGCFHSHKTSIVWCAHQLTKLCPTSVCISAECLGRSWGFICMHSPKDACATWGWGWLIEKLLWLLRLVPQWIPWGS